MLRQLIGWGAALGGLTTWLAAKFLHVGPLAGMNRLVAFFIVALLCWGGILLIGWGERTRPEVSSEGPDAHGGAG